MPDDRPEAALADRVIVLQGATGAVGGALARRLTRAGAKLALPVRRGWQVDKLASDLDEARAGDGGPVRLIAEVGPQDAEAAAGFAKGATDSLGPPDALISCAGAFAMAAVGEDDADLAARSFEANVLAPYTLLRAFVPGMKRRGAGRIVLTGAAAAEGDAIPKLGLYVAAKAALRELARTLRAETDLGVHLVTPGIVDTPANRESMPDADRSDWVSIDAVCDRLAAAAAGALDSFRIDVA